jgi:tetratricopeptide (TPR) repeat protein
MTTMRLTFLLCVLLALMASGANAATASKACHGATNSQERLAQGRKLIETGEAQRAITECLQPVIDGYEKTPERGHTRRYSAQNMVQAIIYAALPTDKDQSVEVKDGAWADAYLLKAYALIELKKIPDAQTALQAGIHLSPMNSRYQSELAYTYQVLKDCDKSIETYREAASAAELGSDDKAKLDDLGIAWRGEGYCLVEQGKLDEAEAIYRKALDANPDDRKSQGELQYIAGLRNK